MSGKDLAVSLSYVVIAANLLDIDFALAEAIDKAHLLEVPAMAIIKRLEQGISRIKTSKAIFLVSLFFLADRLFIYLKSTTAR